MSDIGYEAYTYQRCLRNFQSNIVSQMKLLDINIKVGGRNKNKTLKKKRKAVGVHVGELPKAIRWWHKIKNKSVLFSF